MLLTGGSPPPSQRAAGQGASPDSDATARIALLLPRQERLGQAHSPLPATSPLLERSERREHRPDDPPRPDTLALDPKLLAELIHAPREHLTALAGSPHSVAFLFGSERFGMSNDDVYRCHAALTIPTAPGYGSLNLAAAIQVIAYEWRTALGGFAPAAGGVRPPVPADAQAIAGMLAHWERALVRIGFLDPAAPKKLMPRLNQLFNRAQLTSEEIHILRGVAKAMAQAPAGPKR